MTRLGGTPDGYDPQAAPVQGADGGFYGTTEAGGAPNCGTIYKVASDGTLTTLYAFTGGADGANPKAALVPGSDGDLYGTTSSGGTGNTGTVFSVTPTGTLTTLHGFTARDASRDNPDGAYPSASLIQGADGNFYGTAYQGGAHGAGTAFRITPAGAFITLYSFGAAADGSDGGFPITALAAGGDGNFYGTTQAGGGSGDSGLIFRLTPTGGFTALYPFTGGADGYRPGTLIRGADGNFYGTTQYGGASGGGTAFRVTPAGALTTLHPFAPTVDGSEPEGALLQGTDGNFYGTTSQRGPNSGVGTVFQMTPGGAVTVLYTFPNVSNSSGRGHLYGANPAAGLTLGGDGNFYGTAAGGGLLSPDGTANGGGTIFQLTPQGALTTLHAFALGGSASSAALLQAADGNFYGTTALGGTLGGGTLFGITPAGAGLGTYDFDPNVDGSRPGAALVQDGSGNIFGTATQGGSHSGGTLFQVVFPAAGQTNDARRLSVAHPHDRRVPAFVPTGIFSADSLYVFLSELGASPQEIADFFEVAGRTQNAASSAQATDAETFYGVAASGGPSRAGALYSYTLGGTANFLYEFGSQANDGLSPMGLLHGSDGNFYGTTKSGGAANAGTVFKYTPGGTVTTLYAFQGTGDGAQPLAGLVQTADGTFYGTTSYGAQSSDSGPSGSGTVFSVTPAGVFKTLHTFAADGSEGAQPKARLLQASDGKLYGTTSSGGASFAGTVFSTTVGGTFANLHGFAPNTGDGGRPLAGLIQGTDGDLYGTTSSGGTDDSGTVYRVTLDPTGGTPTVTLSALVPSATVGSGSFAEFLLTLDQAASTDLHVNLLIKGTAANGQDYVLLKTSKKIKAGKTQKAIKIIPQGDLAGAKKTVVLVLSSGDGYAVGTTGKVKVKLLPAAP